MTESQYPTEDAYLSVCRALHWRTAELRSHGVEPVTLPLNAEHYPPDDYVFPKAWRCFFCDEVFLTKQEASDHFGGDSTIWDQPGCIVKMTETEKAIVEDRREWRNRALLAEAKLEDVEQRLHMHEFDLGRALRKPHLQKAGIHELSSHMETLEGRLFAAEARLKALRRYMEDIGLADMTRVTMDKINNLLRYKTDVPDLTKEEKERLTS